MITLLIDIETFMPYLTTIVLAMLGSYLTVKVNIAELRKDNKHITDRLDQEILNKSKKEDRDDTNMKDMKSDIKNIFKILTQIQINVARDSSRKEVLDTIKDTLAKLHDGNSNNRNNNRN